MSNEEGVFTRDDVEYVEAKLAIAGFRGSVYREDDGKFITIDSGFAKIRTYYPAHPDNVPGVLAMVTQLAADSMIKKREPRRSSAVTIMAAAMIVTVALVLMFGCSERAPSIAESGTDKTGRELKVTTTVYANDEALNAARLAYIRDHGVTAPVEYVDGWAAWTATGDWCQISIVPPRNVNDTSRMKALGHEMAHCLWGDYHN